MMKDLRQYLEDLQQNLSAIVKENFIGFYLHGSITMGGFNPKCSDIDVLVVTKNALSVFTKRQLASFCLAKSKNPFPIEITFLHVAQLQPWQHPCPYDFHYSEVWRERYTTALSQKTDLYFNEIRKVDPDLAAHITVLQHRGICVSGEPIVKVFPNVPKPHYVSAIMGDFQECVVNIEKEPIYCILNMLRVLKYVKDSMIVSKQEAGMWGYITLPIELSTIAKKALDAYSTNGDIVFERKQIQQFKDYIVSAIQNNYEF